MHLLICPEQLGTDIILPLSTEAEYLRICLQPYQAITGWYTERYIQQNFQICRPMLVCKLTS